MQPLMLYASELAACIGRNRYQDVNDAMVKVWSRADRDSFHRAKVRNSVTVKDAHQTVQELGVDVSAAIESHLPPDPEINKVLKRPLVTAADYDVTRACDLLSSQSGDDEERRSKLMKLCTPSGITPLAEDRIALAVDAAMADHAAGKDVAASIRAAIETPSIRDCPEAKKAVESVVFTSRGVAGETGAIEAFQKQTGVAVKSRNDRFYKCTVTCTGDDIRAIEEEGEGYEVDDDIREHMMNVSIGGRVDGLRDDGMTVVETKCRQRRFFDRLPDYELVQIQCYMSITGAKKCDLVQKFGDEIRVKEYEFDEEEWGRICTSAVWFAQQVQMLLRHEWIQDAILQRS